jgi:hypothetical protein
MVDTAPKPIVVSQNAGPLDTLYAAGRLLAVIMTSVPLLLTILGNRDFNALVEFFHGTDGKTLVGAVVSLGVMAWGLYKSHKRGSQIATVALDNRVPSNVATTK